MRLMSTCQGRGIGTLGNGVYLVYASPSVSAHPRRELGLSALGSTLGEFWSWMYHGLTCAPVCALLG